MKSTLNAIHGTRIWRAVRVLLAAIALACVMQPARADALDTLINITSIVLGEPALKDARPLIECVVAKGVDGCFDVQAIAVSEGKQLAKQFLPNDPRIASAVEIIKAAYSKDLLKVLQLTGVEFLPQIACGAVFTVTGPANPIICGTLFQSVADLAKPLFKQLLVTVNNPSPANLLALVSVVDVDLACKIVPKFPGKDEICGPLGEVVKLTKDAAVAAAKAGKEVGKFLLDAGKAIVNGIGGAFESACEGLGLCDDGGKKLMSTGEYYKYVLFPQIHDRVVARLVHGQQDLGHDSASLNACLKYYAYEVYQKFMPSAAQSVKKACTDLGLKLNAQADAMAKAFAAAPASYFESAVKPLVPTMAVEGFGRDKLPGFTKFVTTICVTSMRAHLPLVEPTKPGTTAWDYACSKVGGQFEVAYKAQEQQLKGELAKLALFGVCKVPAGWSVSAKGVKLECDSYPGYSYCLQTLAPGKEKDRCAVNAQLADVKFAQAAAKNLGEKRCHANGNSVVCNRPWKVDSCKALVAGAALPPGTNSGVQCKADLVAYAVLESKAKNVIASLNGVHSAGRTVTPDGKSQGLAMVTPGGGARCAHTWDPIAIKCNDAQAWQTTVSANVPLQLPHCALDAAHDGADGVCYSMPYPAGGAPVAPVKSQPSVLPPAASNPPASSSSGSTSARLPTTGGLPTTGTLPPSRPANVVPPPRTSLTAPPPASRTTTSTRKEP